LIRMGLKGNALFEESRLIVGVIVALAILFVLLKIIKIA